MSAERIVLQRWEQPDKTTVTAIRYKYDIDNASDFGFDVSMLCEVGQPYQPWFKAELERRGYIVADRAYFHRSYQGAGAAMKETYGDVLVGVRK